MNNNTRLTRNYAISLFSTAKTVEMQSEFYTQLQAISQVLSTNVECGLLLCAPIVHKARKLRLVSIIAQHVVANHIIAKFLSILVDNSRYNILTDIIFVYYELLANAKGVVLTKVTSATRLLQQHNRDQVQNYLESILQQKLEIRFCHDPDIIAGLVVEYDSYLLDYSVAGALSRIAKLQIR